MTELQQLEEKVAAMIQMREQDRAVGDPAGTRQYPKWCDAMKRSRIDQAKPIVALVRRETALGVLEIMEEWGIPHTDKTLNWGGWITKYGDVSLEAAIKIKYLEGV